MTRFAAASRLVLAGSLSLFAGGALADAIDGDWCAPGDARHVRIEGPTITTSGGNRIAGTYSRHAFSYTVPTGEPGAGDAVSMRLLNEEEVRVVAGSAAAEIWRRCQLNA